MEWESVDCNLCDSSDREPYLTRGDLNVFLNGQFTLVRCRSCGLVYLNPRPARQYLASLYPEHYDQYDTRAVNRETRLQHLERGYGIYKRCQAILRYKSVGRLLDVGCATGEFLDRMRKYLDWQVAGVELSDFASTYARETLGLDVQTGTLETTRFSEGSFDVVTFWDVIEHVPNPLETLRRAYRLLRSDGLLVLRTPNLDSLDARVFGSYWIGYELPRHLYVFSRRTLERLLQKAGFCVVGIRCIYGSHAAAMSSVRFWLRDKAREWSGREVAERLLFSRLARLIAMPYFFVMDQLLLSSGPTLFCAKVDMK